MENKLVVSPDMEPSLWARYLNAYTALIKEGATLPHQFEFMFNSSRGLASGSVRDAPTSVLWMRPW